MLHLELLQNISYALHVVQYILVAFLKVYLLAALGPHCHAQASSCCGERGLLLSHGVHFSWGSFPCCRAQALGCMDFGSCSTLSQECLVAPGLVAPQHVEPSWTRHQTRAPCIGRQTLNHWPIQGTSPCSLFYTL